MRRWRVVVVVVDELFIDGVSVTMGACTTGAGVSTVTLGAGGGGTSATTTGAGAGVTIVVVVVVVVSVAAGTVVVVGVVTSGVAADSVTDTVERPFSGITFTFVFVPTALVLPVPGAALLV